MRRNKTLIVGIACGVICAVCVALYTNEVNGRAEAARAEALSRYGGEQIEVCVAARDIAAGETIEESAIETKLWVADLLPEGAIQTSELAVGKQVTSSILQGEVICEKRFGSNDASVDVPSGMVALSVPARDVQAVGGAVSPGAKVDVYATGSSSTKRIAKSVLVLATSAATSEYSTGEDVSWVTIAVEPDRVQEIVALAQTAELYFTLPGEDESESTSLGESVDEQVLGQESGQ